MALAGVRHRLDRNRALILQFDDASITTVGVLIGALFLVSGFRQNDSGLVAGWLR